MIRGIVAIDEKRGMANDDDIPWNIPGDKKYFVDQLQTGLILMGYGTYIKLNGPFGKHDNYVATFNHESLKEGFIQVKGAVEFLKSLDDDIWNIGGPGLLATTMHLLDELYITQLEGDFGCTKFLPEFKESFSLTTESAPQRENDITYTYQVWTRNDS